MGLEHMLYHTCCRGGGDFSRQLRQPGVTTTIGTVVIDIAIRVERKIG